MIVWRGNNIFEELILPVVKNRLPSIKYNREFLHFFKRIEESKTMRIEKRIEHSTMKADSSRLILSLYNEEHCCVLIRIYEKSSTIQKKALD